MLRDGCDFKSAAKSLGCWDSDGVPVKPRPTVIEQHLTLIFKIEGIEHSASVRDEPRGYTNKIRRFYRAASDRLCELRQGAAENYPNETEECWARMECALPELREAGIYE